MDDGKRSQWDQKEYYIGVEGFSGQLRRYIEVLAVFNQVSVLFIFIVVGFVIKRAKVIDDSLNKGLTNFILYVALPALTIDSMNLNFSKSMLVNSGLLLTIAIGVYAFAIVLSIFIPAILGVEKSSAGVYKFCTIFPNWGFMGYPIAYTLYGKVGMFYAIIFTLPLSFLVWTLGIMIIGKEDKNKVEFKNLLNPGIIAAFIGLFLFLFSVKLPEVLGRSLEMLGNTTTPLIMVVIGSILGNLKVKTIFKDVKILIISLIRLIVMPIVVLTVLKLVHNPFYHPLSLKGQQKLWPPHPHRLPGSQYHCGNHKYYPPNRIIPAKTLY